MSRSGIRQVLLGDGLDGADVAGGGDVPDAGGLLELGALDGIAAVDPDAERDGVGFAAVDFVDG